jgi:hypothetical protein
VFSTTNGIAIANNSRYNLVWEDKVLFTLPPRLLDMASLPQVKQYLAHWFQLGKRVYLKNGDIALLPSKVFQGMDYTIEFELCWESLLSPLSGDCYLEGTSQTLADLLTPNWEIAECSRCQMPVPMRVAGMPIGGCPCDDLPNWPNNQLPSPISPQKVQSKLSDIQDRLDRAAAPMDKALPA